MPVAGHNCDLLHAQTLKEIARSRRVVARAEGTAFAENAESVGPRHHEVVAHGVRLDHAAPGPAAADDEPGRKLDEVLIRGLDSAPERTAKSPTRRPDRLASENDDGALAAQGSGPAVVRSS